MNCNLPSVGRGAGSEGFIVERRQNENQVAQRSDFEISNRKTAEDTTSSIVDREVNADNSHVINELDVGCLVTQQSLQSPMTPEDPIDLLGDVEGENDADQISSPMRVEDPDSNSNTCNSMPLKIGNWRVLWGLLMTTGSYKMTRLQYHAMRTLANTLECLNSGGSWKTAVHSGWNELSLPGAMKSLPHYSTICKNYKPMLHKYLTVRATDISVPINSRKAGARPSSYSANGIPETQIRVVLPSEFARADVATSAVFRLMRDASLAVEDEPNSQRGRTFRDECVDNWPIVAARKFFYGSSTTISVDNRDDCEFAEVEDTILLTLFGLEDGIDSSLLPYCVSGGDSGHLVIRGIVTSIWSVHHYSRKNIQEFRPEFEEPCYPEDMMLAEAFGFVEYRSPSDIINVEMPEVPTEMEGDEDNGIGG